MIDKSIQTFEKLTIKDKRSRLLLMLDDLKDASSELHELWEFVSNDSWLSINEEVYMLVYSWIVEFGKKIKKSQTIQSAYKREYDVMQIKQNEDISEMNDETWNDLNKI